MLFIIITIYYFIRSCYIYKTIYRRSYCFISIIYNANYENSDRGTINGTINGIINGTINENEKIVYTLMKENPKITVTKIIEKTNIPRRTINRIITSLKEKEMIDREGSNKGGHWKILK